MFQELEEKLAIKVTDERLWLEALTHPSYANEHPSQGPSYERMEFFGDAIVGAAVAQILLQTYPDSPPGQLTFLRSILVRREHLAAWARTLPLDSLVRVGKGARSLDAHGYDSILADIAESIIAAIYLENGMPAVLQLVSNTIAADIPSYENARLEYEPKNVLQEKLAAAGADIPRYDVIQDNDEGVSVEVKWRDGSATATGRSKKEASVLAAKKAVGML